MSSDRITELLKQRNKVLSLLSSIVLEEKLNPQGIREGGNALGFQDHIYEDLLILSELKSLLTPEQWKNFLTGGDMTSEREKELYFAARNRTLERHIDRENLIIESLDGFLMGIGVASSGVEVPPNLSDRIKSETNFSFAFICGVLARLEAVKGKGYQASWQRRGEVEGAMVNIDRKYDRLEATVREGAKGETVSQILGDLSVYAIKWTTLRTELEPKEFLAWVKEVQDLVLKSPTEDDISKGASQ